MQAKSLEKTTFSHFFGPPTGNVTDDVRMDSDKSSEETRSSRERDNRDIERGKRIRALRDETGMTQTGFAQLVGVNRPSTISDWENGWSEPQRSQMKRLADAFDVPFRSMEAYIRWGQPLRARGRWSQHWPGCDLADLADGG